MNFSSFIASHVDDIMVEWEVVARAVAPSRAITRNALRDDWAEILKAVADEMESAAPAQQSVQGRSRTALEAAAAQHGARRQQENFELDELVAEFRAMRSTVLAAWQRSERRSGEALSVAETTCFSEALDRALAGSIERHSTERARVRDLFLAMLGHDLRDPLSGISMATHVLDRPGLDDRSRLQAVVRIKRALKLMDHLITDLLDFTRSRLGSGLPIAKSRCHLARLAEEALDAIRASFPERKFYGDISGDLSIDADPARIGQLLSNLLYNAVQHGDPIAGVSLRAHGDADSVKLQVHNEGLPIPQDALQRIFEPLVQSAKTTSGSGTRSSTSMGLGLFIVKEIGRGHGGTVMVESSAEAGTTFTVHLPRCDGGPCH